MSFILGAGVGLLIVLIFRKQLLEGRKVMIEFVKRVFRKTED